MVKTKMSENGLKLAEKPKEDGQKTLEEAFDAGKMYKEAKKIKKKVMKNRRRFMVMFLFKSLW